MSAGTTLPKRVDPRRLAVACGEIEGAIPLASLPRLSAATPAPPAEAKAWLKLAFAEDAQRRVTMRGRLQAVLSLQCQRCLGSLAWTVESELRLIAVADEDAAAQVPRDHDPVVVDSRGLDVAALVEDELILALPVVARCEDKQCSPAALLTQKAGRKENPFAALTDWQRR